MSKQVKIKLIRISQYVNSKRNFEIYIDNELRTRISDGEEKVIEVISGEHTVVAKIDCFKSKKIDLNLNIGDEVKLICGSKISGWKKWMTLFYLFSKNKFIFLDFYSEEKILKYQEKNLSDLKKKGLIRFVLRQGILDWGITTGILISAINFIFNYSQLSFVENIYRVLSTIIIFSICGIVPGLIMWFIPNEK